MATISEVEKLRRRRMIESVIGTNAMEGIALDDATLALMKRFEVGEFEIDDLSAAIDLHVQQMVLSRPPEQKSVVSMAVDAA